MNYQEQCLAMMKDLGDNFSEQRFAELIQALGNAMVKTAALIPDHENMHVAMNAVCNTMQEQACAEHRLLHPAKPMNAETFLRDVFKPEKLNG